MFCSQLQEIFMDGSVVGEFWVKSGG